MKQDTPTGADMLSRTEKEQPSRDDDDTELLSEALKGLDPLLMMGPHHGKRCYRSQFTRRNDSATSSSTPMVNTFSVHKDELPTIFSGSGNNVDEESTPSASVPHSLEKDLTAERERVTSEHRTEWKSLWQASTSDVIVNSNKHDGRCSGEEERRRSDVEEYLSLAHPQGKRTHFEMRQLQPSLARSVAMTLARPRHPELHRSPHYPRSRCAVDSGDAEPNAMMSTSPRPQPSSSSPKTTNNIARWQRQLGLLTPISQ